MSRYTKTMSEVLAEMSEGFSKKEIKMAIGIASDPRYKGGNYTGAFKAIARAEISNARSRKRIWAKFRNFRFSRGCFRMCGNRFREL